MAEYVVNKKTYTLKYSMGRIETMEKASGRAVMGDIAKMANNDLMPISTLLDYFAYGLYDVDKNVYAPIKDAKDIARDKIEEIGYADMLNDVVLRLQEDCGFLFRSASSNSNT